MINISFENDVEIIVANDHLYQWDVGQSISISGITLNFAPKIHFSAKGDKEALVVQSRLTNGVISCGIPDEVLQRGKDIRAYIYVENILEKSTIKLITIPVLQRTKPSDYVSTIPSEVEKVQNQYEILLAELQELQNTLNGILNGDISLGNAEMLGGKSADSYAIKSTEIEATLLASGWSENIYNLTIEGATTISNQELLPSLSITAEQLEALQSANIQDGGQSTDTIILKAFGDVPTIDIPIRVILRGDA